MAPTTPRNYSRDKSLTMKRLAQGDGAVASLHALAAWLNVPVAFPLWVLPGCTLLAGVASYLWWHWWIPEFLERDGPGRTPLRHAMARRRRG